MSSAAQARFDLTHALQVASRAAYYEPDGWLTGLLHDALEDTDLTADDLHEARVPPDVVEAVEVLTRREGEPYFEYIDRVGQNALARAVKMADLDANLARSDPEHQSLRKRYELAYWTLSETRLDAANDHDH